MVQTLRLCCVWGALAVALLTFSRGFLLARIHLPRFSVPAEVSHSELSQNQSSSSPPPFSKALVLVVDALRLDFLRARKYSIASQHVESMQGVLNAAELMVWPRLGAA